MSVQTENRLLWIIVGGGLLIAANAIPYYLRYIRTITEVNHDDVPSKGPCEDAEDALKLDTLEKLAGGPSYKLRASAVKIIAERSSREAPRKLLLQHLASQLPSVRDQALQALWFLLSHSSLKSSPEIMQTFTHDPTTFRCLVVCLANLLTFHDDSNNKRHPFRADNPTSSSPLLPHGRPPAETLTLLILRKLLTDQTCSPALSAGLVSKWLKHYPFPCALSENGSHRQEVVKLFKTWGSDDPLMASIMSIITRHPEGLKQLRRHGLTGSSYGEAEIDFGGVGEGQGGGMEDVFMTDGEDTAGYPSTMVSTVSSVVEPRPGSSWARRPHQDNQAERAVRQRRREATVYSEGNAPLTQRNIFQRQPSNSNLAGSPGGAPVESTSSPEIEAELAGLREEIEHAVSAAPLEDVREENLTRRREEVTMQPSRTSGFWRWLTMSSGQASSH